MLPDLQTSLVAERQTLLLEAAHRDRLAAAAAPPAALRQRWGRRLRSLIEPVVARLGADSRDGEDWIVHKTV